MIDFLMEVARFGLKAGIILIVLLVMIAFIASIVSKSKESSEIKVKVLNKKLQKNRMALLSKKLNKKELKQVIKDNKARSKDETHKKSIYVLSFDGDIKASATDSLRQEITTLLSVATPDDQVVLKLESPGGMVHGYGLAASQLQRIKDAQLKLTICVDKVAASGGYMMACLADRLVAAPFAIIGSIGVIASVPNVHKLLKKNDIDYLEITAGEFKRTITPLGEITEAGMTKFRGQIEEVHELFKKHVVSKRPMLDLSRVATGEYWYGQQAKDLDLIDELGTSDDILFKLSEDHKIFEIEFVGKKTIKDMINESLGSLSQSLLSQLEDTAWKRRFF
jgi:serine protease SohB